jgi:hypothetical protein
MPICFFIFSWASWATAFSFFFFAARLSFFLCFLSTQHILFTLGGGGAILPEDCPPLLTLSLEGSDASTLHSGLGILNCGVKR